MCRCAPGLYPKPCTCCREVPSCPALLKVGTAQLGYKESLAFLCLHGSKPHVHGDCPQLEGRGVPHAPAIAAVPRARKRSQASVGQKRRNQKKRGSRQGPPWWGKSLLPSRLLGVRRHFCQCPEKVKCPNHPQSRSWSPGESLPWR